MAVLDGAHCLFKKEGLLKSGPFYLEKDVLPLLFYRKKLAATVNRRRRACKRGEKTIDFSYKRCII